VGRARAKPTIVKNLRPDLRFNELVGFAPLYPPYKKNAFMLNLMALVHIPLGLETASVGCVLRTGY